VLEREYAPIRKVLVERGYRTGPLDMINNALLTGDASKPNDDERWGQAQYVMVPWIVVRAGRVAGGVSFTGGPARFVIGDFWDERPQSIPPDLIKIYEGPHIFLFERKPQ